MALIRPTLVTMEEIDTALALRYAGLTVTLLDGGLTTVPVLLEDNVPHDSASYPKITIEWQSDGEEEAEREGSYDQYVSAQNLVADPYEISMRDGPQKSRQIYQIKAWVKNDFAAMRALKGTMNALVGRKDYLTIAKTDPADVVRQLWMLQQGETTMVKERKGDELILQLVWQYAILCELDSGGAATEKAVKTVEMGLWKGVTEDEDVDVLYRRFTYDDTDFTPS